MSEMLMGCGKGSDPAPTQFTLTLNTAGTSGTITLPNSLVSVDSVECWGGGGGGGGGDGTAVKSGCGGGGGAYSKDTAPTVATSAVLNYSLGALGTGAVGGVGATTPGVSGGDAVVTYPNATTVTAKGGSGGATADLVTLPAGGQASAGSGGTKFSGGAGFHGSATFGGGAGSSAGTAAIGTSANSKNGTTAPSGGGNGGGGGLDVGAGTPGSAPGGGGGGGGDSNQTGGNGAAPKVVVIYTAYGAAVVT